MANFSGKPEVQTSDDIQSDNKYEDNDFSMDIFVNDLVQNTIEGVMHGIEDDQTADTIVAFSFGKLTRERMGNVSVEAVSSGSSRPDNKTPEISTPDRESDFEDFLLSRQSSTNKLLRSINQLERTTLPLARRVFSETNATMAKLNQVISSGHEGRGQGISSSTLHSDIPRVGSVSSIREMFERSKIQLYKAASDTSMLKIKRAPSIVYAPEVQSIKVNYPEIQSVKLNDTDTQPVKLTIPDIQSVKLTNPEIHSHKVLSLNAPRSQSDKVVNELKRLFESKEREKLNRNIRLTQDELEMVTIGSSILSDASLKSCSILHSILEKVKQIPGDIDIVTNIPNDTSLMGDVPVVNATPATMANIIQQQVACKINKKPSFVKRATSRISGAMRGMTRLFTSCGSSRRSTGRNANSVPPNNILH